MGEISLDSLFMLNTLLDSRTVLIALIVALAIGVLMCLFGYRFARVWVAIAGFLAGTSIAWTLLERLNVADLTRLIISLVAGVAICLIAALIFKLGLFLFTGFLAGMLCMSIMMQVFRVDFTVSLIISAAVFLAIGACAVHFERPIIIVMMSLAGGLIVAVAAMLLLKLILFAHLFLIGALVIAVLGMLFQFYNTRRMR